MLSLQLEILLIVCDGMQGGSTPQPTPAGRPTSDMFPVANSNNLDPHANHFYKLMWHALDQVIKVQEKFADIMMRIVRIMQVQR